MVKDGLLGRSLSRRDAMKRAMQGSAYAAPIVLGATIAAPRVGAASPIPAACTRPLTRELAPTGSGSGGTTQTTANCGGGFIQTFNITLTGASANTAYDVYLDQESIGSATSHIFAGTFTTDAAGNASFTSTIKVPVAVSILDNEVVLHDPTHSNFTEHQFIQDSFAPCPVPCPTGAASAGVPAVNITGSGTAVDAPHR